MRQATEHEKECILKSNRTTNIISRLVLILLVVLFLVINVFIIFQIIKYSEYVTILILLFFDPLLLAAMWIVLRNSKSIIFEFEKIYSLRGVLIVSPGFRNVKYYINNFEVHFPVKILKYLKDYKSGDVVDVEVMPVIYSDREIHYIVTLNNISI